MCFGIQFCTHHRVCLFYFRKKSQNWCTLLENCYFYFTFIFSPHCLNVEVGKGGEKMTSNLYCMREICPLISNSQTQPSLILMYRTIKTIFFISLYLLQPEKQLPYSYKLHRSLLLSIQCFKRNKCIAGYALSRVIRRIQSEIYFGNPDWFMEWLGAVDRRYPAYHSNLRIPPSPFCGNPLPPTPWDVIGCGNGGLTI
jgi:hypothetical protein